MQESLRENISGLLPVITEFEKPFWEGLQNKQLLIQKCHECGNVQFPPSSVCTRCLSDKVEWTVYNDKATLWSKVVFHKIYFKQYDDVPYTVGMAKIKGGPIVTGRIAEKHAKTLNLDDPVRIEFCTTVDGTVLVVFEPDN